MPFDLDARVIDRWWPHWGVGTVIARKKTRLTVRFPDRTLTYDRTHCQFLEEA